MSEDPFSQHLPDYLFAELREVDGQHARARTARGSRKKGAQRRLISPGAGASLRVSRGEDPLGRFSDGRKAFVAGFSGSLRALGKPAFSTDHFKWKARSKSSLRDLSMDEKNQEVWSPRVPRARI